MKTISKRFLKGGLAVLLAVIMLFSSCITGFAAVVDTAQTGGNHGANARLYFVKPDNWTNVSMLIGHNSYSEMRTFSKLSGNLYYYKMVQWDNWTEWIMVDATGWSSNGEKPSARVGGAAHKGSTNTSYAFNANNTYRIGTGTSHTYYSGGYSALNSTTQTVYSYSAAANGTTYSADANAAKTLTVKTVQLSGNGTLGSATTTSKTATASSANRTAAQGSSVTVTTSANDGYTFEGWYSASSGGTRLSTSTSYTYNASTGNTSVYARFKKMPVATFVDEDGTELQKGYVTSGTTPSFTGITPSKDYYTFTGWNPTLGAITADTTYTATYSPIDYTITYNTNGGTINGTYDETYNIESSTITLPTNVTQDGYTFLGWKDANGNTVTSIPAGSTGNKEFSAEWQLDIANYDVEFDVATKSDENDYTTDNANGGYVKPDASGTHASGTKLTVEAIANDGYRFVGWYDGNTRITTDASNEFTVTGNKTYVARFIAEYSMKATGSTGVEASVSAGTVDAGEEVTFTATVEDGYRFDGWFDGGDKCSDETTYTVTASRNLNLIAQATRVYPATVAVYRNGVANAPSADVTISPETAATGETVTITINSDNGDNFYGLYNTAEFGVTPDYEYISENNEVYTYEITMPEGGLELYAHFNDIYSGFTYDPVSNEYNRTITVGDDVDAYTFTIKDGDNYEVSLANGTLDGVTITEDDGTYTVDINEIDYDPSQAITLTLTLENGNYVLNAYAVAKDRFYVTYAEGTNGSGATDYAVGAPVELTIEVGNNVYLKDVTVGNLPSSEVTIVGNKVSFDMPADDVEVSAEFGTKRFVNFADQTGLAIEWSPSPNGYKPETPVTVTIRPQSEAYTINDTIEVTNEKGEAYRDCTVAEGTEAGTYVITIPSMPDYDLIVKTEVDAKFLMDYKVVTVDSNTNNPTGGRVAMTVDDEPITNEKFIEQGTEVTYTATANADYTFVGYFSDSDCTKLLSTDAVYTFVPVDYTTVYALFARRMYITGAFNNWPDTGWPEMQYDYKLKSYAYTVEDLTTCKFKVSVTDGDYETIINATGFNTPANTAKSRGYTTVGYTDGDTNNMYFTGLQSGYSAPTTIYLTPVSYQNYEFYAKATRVGATVYLSSGRLDLQGDIDQVTEFVDHENDDDLSVSALKSISNNDKKTDKVVEKYYVGTMSKAHSFTVQTNLSGDNAKDYYVDSYVIYYIDSQTYDVITSDEIANMGANRYSASITCNGDCYIVPVLYHNDAYLNEHKIEAFNIYFDAAQADMDTWGPFVACYAYGEGIEMNGSWPGQIMIPDDKGTSFSIRVELDPNANFQGVVFDNYLKNSVPHTECVAFGLGTDPNTVLCNQTYDYKESVYLHEAGYSAITYVMKSSYDGYHGMYIDEDNEEAGLQNEWTPRVQKNNIKDLVDSGKLVFEPLTNREGTHLMDLEGNDIGTNLNATPDYYVISAGDINVNKGDAYDKDYAGKWSVSWFIYNAHTGDYIASALSGTMYYVDDVVGPVLDYIMSDAGEDITGKVVNISYEHNNACLDEALYEKEDGTKDKIRYSTNKRFDGQWYGNLATDTMHTEIYVGLYNETTGEYDIANDNNPNKEAYGEAYINGMQNYEVAYGAPIVNLSATPLVDNDGNVYKYDGLYIIEDGEYVRISESYKYSTTVTHNTTYYALFTMVGEGKLLITHQPYVNVTDTQILSHNGIATMTVDIYGKNPETDEYDVLLASGDESTTLSQICIPVTSGENYRVVITTTPLNQGKFYAWYTDSFTVDGKPTYEEIMTKGEDVDKTKLVTTEFLYKASATSQKIVNIYSDVTRVTNKATLVYKYINRFGEERIYTHPEDIILSDQECLGYEGNGGQPYVPTYLTAYTMVKYADDGETILDEKNVYGAGDYETYEALGYAYVNSSNNIDKYAPSDKVTQAIDEDVTWEVEDVYLTTQKSLVILKAKQEDKIFKVTATLPDKSQIIKEGPYNTLMEGIEAPHVNDEGEKFLYWADDTTGEILSYQREYNYRIVENKNISAVYGEEAPEWAPVIDSVTYTREFQDSSDYVYSDFLITFNNRDMKELDVMKAEGASVKYGLIMVRDNAYTYNGEGAKAYPEHDLIKSYIEKVAARGKDTRITSIPGRVFDAYHYNLTGYDSTNFNRMEYYVRYNNDVPEYKTYTFTAYAYIIVDGVTYVSAPKEVSIYDAATASHLQQQ